MGNFVLLFISGRLLFLISVRPLRMCPTIHVALAYATNTHPSTRCHNARLAVEVALLWAAVPTDSYLTQGQRTKSDGMGD